MLASLLVFGVMIGLIVLSVILFGTQVAEGPLQVSMPKRFTARKRPVCQNPHKRHSV